MLRQLCRESLIVATLTCLLIVLTATAGLPGRPDRPARAASSPAGNARQNSRRPTPSRARAQLVYGMSGYFEDVR